MAKYRGCFNKYRREMPFFEVIMKDVNYLNLWLKNYIKHGFQSKSIYVHPHYPSRGSTIYKVGKHLGYNISNKEKKSSRFAVYWEYLTHRDEYQKLETYGETKTVVNLFSRDISKIYIDKVHQDIFGYSTIVDPTKYSGKVVKKNDINAKHDGSILQGPIEKVEEGYIYQILIDNSCSQDQVEDIRVPVVKQLLDFGYIKRRSIKERFKNVSTESYVEKISELFSKTEIDRLNAYCKALHLEYGELDVLRNKNDQKIYVVDVNNTPQGPPDNIDKQMGDQAIAKIAKALIDNFEN